MTDKIRVVLVDDHALCRSGLSDLLHHRGNFEVVASLGNPDLVAGVLLEHKPALLVLDLRMPGVEGSACCAACAPRVATRRP